MCFKGLNLVVVRRHTLQHNRIDISGVMLVYHEWRSSGSSKTSPTAHAFNLEKEFLQPSWRLFR